MKPIHLNLASRPYRDYRPLYAVVVAVSCLTALLGFNNVETWYRYRHETETTRSKIADLEAQARVERDRAATVEQRMKGIDVDRLDSQTKFINAKLAERAFSWSALLDHLENVLSDDVRLVSIGPRFLDDGQVDLTLQLETKSANGMIDTINRMYRDPRFSNPFPGSESKLAEGGYAFNLTVRYLPPGIAPKPAQRTSAKGVRR